MKNTRVMILLLMIFGGLFIFSSVAYSLYSYKKVGNEINQLLLGDIYMNYTESNQINLQNIMPGGINTLTFYEVNPVMKTEETGTGILGKCELFFNNLNYEFDSLTTATTFCQGLGTAYGGYSFQDDLDCNMFDDEIANLLSDEIIIKREINYTSFLANKTMESEISGEGILGKCEKFFQKETFDEGITATTFCQGLGTKDGMTLQEYFDTNYKNELFMLESGKKLLDYQIIVPKIDFPYFKFEISGKNTSNKDIWYDIELTHGDSHETRQTRIQDKFLKFTLTEIRDTEEIILLGNQSYDNLINQKIYTDIIPANSKEFKRYYRLYMWIDENVVICGRNVSASCNYYNLGDTNNWNDVFASIKVNVKGDFYNE